MIRQSKASIKPRSRPSADKRQSCARSLPKESYIGRTRLRAASAVYDRLKMEKHPQRRSDIIDPEVADWCEPRYPQPRARAHSCGSRRETHQAARPACLCRAHSCFAAAYQWTSSRATGRCPAIRQPRPGASCGRCCSVREEAASPSTPRSSADASPTIDTANSESRRRKRTEHCASFGVKEIS